MNNTDYRLSLDIFKTSSQATLPVKQFDTAYRLCITLTANGFPYSITEGCYAIFTAKKPDGNFINNKCTIENNTIYYDLTPQTTAALGIVECEVVIYEKADTEESGNYPTCDGCEGCDVSTDCNRGKQLATPHFNILVDKKAYNGEDIVSSSENGVLDSLVENADRAEAARDKAVGYALSAQDAADNSSASADVAGEYSKTAKISASEAKVAATEAEEQVKIIEEKLASGEFKGEIGPQGPPGVIKFIPVKELPTEDIDVNAIYLVPAKNTDAQNNYEEFVNIYGVWESLGIVPVEVDLSDYVKKTQFADKNGNAGILRLKSGYGISSGRYDGNSPVDGDTIYISKASDNQIKYKSGLYNPIVPENLDYAVLCGLAYSKYSWTETEKKAAMMLLDNNFIAKISPVFEEDTIIAEGRSLTTGKKYEVAYRTGDKMYKATATAKNSNLTSHGTVCHIDCVLNGVHKYVYSINGNAYFDENGNYEEGTVRFVSVKEL
ncbi:MAG: hypothetical protein II304_05220 [Bacteroidales bacterium]|nr:hypothetical protein [Bacteroidales bacterium]